MTELVLVRSREDRRHYDLEGWGSVQKDTWRHPPEFTTRDGRRFTTATRGFFRYSVSAYAENGSEVGEYLSNFGSGGELNWDGKFYQLRRDRRLRRDHQHRKSLVLTRLGIDYLHVRDNRWHREAPVLVTVREPATDPAIVMFVMRLFLLYRSDQPTSGGGGG